MAVFHPVQEGGKTGIVPAAIPVVPFPSPIRSRRSGDASDSMPWKRKVYQIPAQVGIGEGYF